MVTETEIPVEERIVQVLQYLGIEQAHFGGLNAADWGGLAVKYPDRIVSLTLVGPVGMTNDGLAPLASRLLVFSGDRGTQARAIARATEDLRDANVVVFKDYETMLYSDTVADHSEEIISAMLELLDGVAEADHELPGFNAGDAGEVAGVTYRIQGAGPPLVLFPLALARSQWEPIQQRLSEKFCVIQLGGAHIGHIRYLEIRAQTGYKSMVRNLMADLQISDGEAVLDVGCGSGVFDRVLADLSGGRNHITAVDYSPYMVAEAKGIAQAGDLEGAIDFQVGNAEALTFPDGSFDVVFSVTVLEEGDADRMLSEMVRVTKPGGRIGVIVRSLDSPWVVNLPISDDLRRKLEQPGTIAGGVSKGGCADRSLYSRFVQAGLLRINASAQLATFGEGLYTAWWEPAVLAAVSDEGAEEWKSAAAQAKAEGTFFIAQPFHCAVGTKPG